MRFSTVITSSMVCFAASGVALDLERREAYALGEELVARGQHLIARGEHLMARAPGKPAKKAAAPAKKAAAPAKKAAAPAKKGAPGKGGLKGGSIEQKGYCQKDGGKGFCVTPQGSPTCSPDSPCEPDMGTCYWNGGGVLCYRQH